MTFNSTLQRHCARAVPIVLVDNAIDQLSTVRTVLDAVSGEEGHDLMYVWSSTDGLKNATGESGKYAIADTYLSSASAETGGYTNNVNQALDAVSRIVTSMRGSGRLERAGFVFFTGDRLLSDRHNDAVTFTIQKLLDIRDSLKSTRSCVYFVGIQFEVPKELKEHVVILQAPLPDDEEYDSIINTCYAGYRAARETDDGAGHLDYVITDEDREQFREVLKGMSAFAAEQTVYLSTDMDGMHLEEMRQRAIQTINSTRGLSVIKGDGRGYHAIGGLKSIKEYTKSLINGRLKMKLIVFIDEIEKVVAGHSSDTSGVSQNYLGTLLSEMQDSNALGMMLTGIYGTGKSEFAKRTGEEAGTLCIHLDLAGMKDSLVGSSEANLRQAMNVIRSIGGTDGGVVYLATCNRISQLPPELKRRFNLGTFFFYFPDHEEREVIWQLYQTKYDLLGDTTRSQLSDDMWTGAEIESCCRIAYYTKSTLAEAASRIVPVATTAKEDIDRLVDESNGKFLSCSYPGVFIKPRVVAKKAETLRQSNFK